MEGICVKQIQILSPAQFLAHLWGFHVKNFGYSSLHDKKMRIVHIQLNRPEQILNSSVVCIASINEVFISTSNHDLRNDKIKINEDQISTK